MTSSRIIHIIDDEAAIRESIGQWLSRKYEVLLFASGKEYLAKSLDFLNKDHGSTCILLDFQMPDINGVELQKTLKLMNTTTPIIFMSGNANQRDIINAWRGGATDFLLKPFGPKQIIEVIEKQFLITDQKNLQSNIELPITSREAQVLLLLGSGLSQKQVAEKLSISINTVKMFRAFLKDKLGLDSLSELIRFYEKNRQSIEHMANQKLRSKNVKIDK